MKPEAEKIISTKSKDIIVIEHALDALCKSAFDDEVMIVFKKLCRYYYEINQKSAIVQFCLITKKTANYV